jgi:Patched family
MQDLVCQSQGLDELDYTQPGLPLRERFGRLMETAGLSVAIIAATNIVAFGLGAISNIPAIHW